MNLRLDRSHRQVQLLGNLVVGVVLQKTHLEELAILRRQALDIVLNLSALLHTYQALLGRGSAGRRGREFFIDREILLTATLEVDVGIACDGIDPLPEGVVGRVAVQIDIDLDEGLLQQILRILHRGRALQKQTTYGIAISVEQILEGHIIPRKREFDQSAVVGDYVFGYFQAVVSLRIIATRKQMTISGLIKSKRKYRSTTPRSPTRFAIELTRATTTT